MHLNCNLSLLNAVPFCRAHSMRLAKFLPCSRVGGLSLGWLPGGDLVASLLSSFRARLY